MSCDWIPGASHIAPETTPLTKVVWLISLSISHVQLRVKMSSYGTNAWSIFRMTSSAGKLLIHLIETHPTNVVNKFISVLSFITVPLEGEEQSLF